ncbi:unnamed protein product [Spirodela intermedia]|uniref:Uncharacterized protein n=1 Tax=Spirodela intermedia TaxID=51605 RepID=A0A7I8JVZ7_SPIIN|nr:unnamed protein product [Spirodela intermedia]
MNRCNRCGERSVVLDPACGLRVCSSCGVEQCANNFQSQAFTSGGHPTGVIVQSIGVSSTRERKIYLADTEIGKITSSIGLSAARSAEVRAMVSEVTEGEFGAGNWFPVLVAACICITMRKNRLPLSIAEAAASIGRDTRDVGRMVTRVCQFLNLRQLPEFDILQHLERTVRRCPSLAGVDEEKAEEMLNQGRFLLQCAVKWFLSTGRQPLPLVAAVTSFVAEVNGVAANLEEIADYIYARPATCKLRKRELLMTLVKVAKVLLPWGEDVTAKNIFHNAPLLLKCMERKSKDGALDLGQFGSGFQPIEDDVSRYLIIAAGDGLQPVEEMDKVKLSAECLSHAYGKASLLSKAVEPSGESEKSLVRKRNREDMLRLCFTSYGGMSSEDLSLEQILERDVGYDPPPPSFLAGLEARQRRKEKIAAAKHRIRKAIRPSSDNSGRMQCHLPLDRKGAKKRRRQGAGGIDWEDCMIELLLLHRANEEEIEHGHYRRLMDLHVFTSMNTYN